MAGPSLLQQSWSLGERRDRSKDQIGVNAAWLLTDWVPDRKGGPLERRGGWEKKGAWGTGLGNITYINAGIFASMNGGEFILVSDEDGAVWRITPGGSTWNIDGTTRDVNLLKQNPILYFDDVIWPSPDGSQTMSRSSETTTSEYTFTDTLKPVYLTQWKNRMVGAVSETIIFGPPGDPNQAWDDAAAYLQTQPIKGLWTIRSATLIFYKDHIEIMRGSVPAGYDVIEGDIRFDHLYGDYGLVDAFSLTPWNDGVCWADMNGIYWTDAAQAVDLTDRCGLRDRWKALIDAHLADFHAGNMRVAAGVYGDLLHVTLSKPGASAYYETVVIDIPRRIGWEYSNLPFSCYIDANHELYAGGIQGSGLVGEISHTITENNPTDEFSTAADVLPSIETPFYRFSQGACRIVDVYIGYVLEGVAYATIDIDPAGANNTLRYTSKAPGYSGNDTTVRYVVAGLNTALSVSVVGQAITVNVATDGAGAATSTGTLVKAAVEASTAASALVTVAAVGTITGIVAAVSATNLAGSQSLVVQFTTDPHPGTPANPAFGDFNDGDEYLHPVDLHGAEAEGYHYRRIPVRLEGSGLAVKVTQLDKSDRTALYNVSIAVIPREGWEQV